MAGRTRRDLESEFQDVLKAEPASAEHGNDLPEPLRSKQRRSSPAEVDRVNGKRQQPCRAVAELNASFLIGSRQLGDLLLKRVRVGIKDARRRHSRAEITEGAFGGTERDLNVDAQIVHTRLTVYRVRIKDRALSVWYHFHSQLACARPVKFAEKDALPSSEHQAAVFH